MRHVRTWVAMLFALLLATGCADAPTAPDRVQAGTAGPSSDYVLEPIIVIGDPRDTCDPWMDLNWCRGDGGGTCMSSQPGEPTDPEQTTVTGCPGGGGDGPGGGGGGTIQPPDDGDCNPNTNPDCLQPLSAWDKETISLAFSRHLRTSFTDPNAARMCNQLATHFNQMMSGGAVFRGAFGSTGEPSDPLHVAAYDQVGGTIHFEPDAMAAANAGDPTAVRNILNSALHEAAHALNYTHTDPVWMGSYDLYAEPPFNLLSPGANSCITNW